MHLHRILTRALTAALLSAITITAWMWWPDPSTSLEPAVVEHPATPTNDGDQFPGIQRPRRGASVENSVGQLDSP